MEFSHVMQVKERKLKRPGRNRQIVSLRVSCIFLLKWTFPECYLVVMRARDPSRSSSADKLITLLHWLKRDNLTSATWKRRQGYWRSSFVVDYKNHTYLLASKVKQSEYIFDKIIDWEERIKKRTVDGPVACALFKRLASFINSNKKKEQLQNSVLILGRKKINLERTFLSKMTDESYKHVKVAFLFLVRKNM